MKQQMTSRVHLMDWAPQDWRTSRIRLRSIRTDDPLLRTVYLEILFALYEAGGSIPSDPEQLEDLLGLPGDVIAERLPLLAKYGRDDANGGIVVADGRITNRRIAHELESKLAFREEQRSRAQRGVELRREKPRRSKARATAQPPLSDGSPVAERPPGDGAAVAEPIPSPIPSHSPVPSPSPIPSPTPSTESGGARVNGGLGIYPNADMAEAAFKTFLAAYPPAGIPSTHVAEHAWAEALPHLPVLGELLAALRRQKGSDQWERRGAIPRIDRWLSERMWTGKLGEAPEQTRYRPFEGT